MDLRFEQLILSGVRNVFVAKYPTPGRVKTRLTPELSPELAARVQKAFIQHWHRRMGRQGDLRPFYFVDPPDSVADFERLLQPGLQACVEPQCAGDLGARLCDATTRIRKTTELLCPLFMGVDSPDVPESMQIDAMKLVTRSSLVIGLSGDGGFWCLGIGQSVDPRRILQNIDWSSGREGGQVIAQARAAGYDVRSVGMWDDVDRPDDLRRLLRRLRRSPVDLDRALLRSLRFLPDEFQA